MAWVSLVLVQRTTLDWFDRLSSWLERLGVAGAAAFPSGLLLLYMPHAAVAVIILGGGVIVGRFADRNTRIASVNAGLEPARLLGKLARGAVIVVAGALALEHLSLAGQTLPSVVLVLLAGATLTAALAVGLGSRDLVGRWIEDRINRPRGPDEDQFHHL